MLLQCESCGWEGTIQECPVGENKQVSCPKCDACNLIFVKENNGKS